MARKSTKSRKSTKATRSTKSIRSAKRVARKTVKSPPRRVTSATRRAARARRALASRAAVQVHPGAEELALQGPLANRARQGAVALWAAFERKGRRRAQGRGPIVVGGEATTEAVLSVIETAGKSGAPDVLVDVFTRRPSKVVAAMQVDAVEAAFLGTMSVALSPDYVEDDPRFGIAVQVALSGSQAGLRAREVLLGRPLALNLPAPVRRGNPLRVEGDLLPLPGISPRVPQDLLRAGERFRTAGCVNSLQSALGAVGKAVADQSPRYRQGAHIDRFTPAQACPGNVLTITGSGFGPSAEGGVVFTSVDARPLVVPAQQCQSWSDTEIVLAVPAGTSKGPVGIVTLPSTAGTAASTLAADAIAEAQTCLGPIAGGRLSELIGRVTGAVLSLPPLQPDRLNYFAGGVPKIHAFSSDRQVLWPGASITLRWIVEGATSIQIAPVPAAAGAVAHELPPIGPTLDPQSGSVTVTARGTRSWEGRYVLRAFNACTGGSPATAELTLRMLVRRGFALGGGGARGDFQVGALRYLYDVKGFRPDAIASTSVGSINAAELVMGDTAAGNGAARLESVWRALTGNSSMWVEEAWLANTKANVRQIVRSLSLEGLLSLPYSIVADIVAGKEIADDIGKGPVAFFNISPIETVMRARFSATRAQASGIALRLVAVSLETAEVIQVDQAGAIISRVTPTGQRSTVIDGAMASAAMPSIFPARRIGDHMCVDGGVRDVVPVQIAVEELGCNEVYAISLSAPLSAQPFKQNRSILEVAARSLAEIVFDEITNNDLAPFRGWGDTVQVHVIDASLNVHDPLIIDPGLIDIAIQYGWMRAGDQLDTPAPARKRARELSDEITRLRAENWDLAFSANGDYVVDRHGSFPILDGAFPAARSPIRPVREPQAVDAVRANCIRIRDRVLERLSLGAPVPPAATRIAWWTQWERIPNGPLGTPWDEFNSTAGYRPAAPPPSPV